MILCKYAIKSIMLLLILESCSSTRKPVNQPAADYYSVADFAAVKKMDTHVHLNTSDTPYLAQAFADNMLLLDIVDDRPFGIPMAEQEKIAIRQVNAFPGRLVYATTFPVNNFNNGDFQQQAIAKIKEGVLNGAVAVKIWKNVGMDLKNKNGQFVMIDDVRFDSILDFCAKSNIPLIAHLGEPRECWLPLDKMTLHKGYYEKHPEYHMYLHPEYPSYERQIEARDGMLEKHPGIQYIGAHLGSLEWSLAELGKRLDKFPNMAVDLSRMPELFLHAKNDYQNTRNFFIKYQDRLLYATDVQVNQTTDPASMKKQWHDSRIRFWTFFVTDNIMIEPGITGSFKGLRLPRDVVDKIYYKNAAQRFDRNNRL